MKHQLTIYVTLAAVALSMTGCASEGYNRGQFNLMSIDEEREWGLKLKADVDQEFASRGMAHNDPELSGYVDRLGRKLLAYAPEVNFDYTFTVVKTDVVNAFAIPGGHVYVHTGLIAEAENEAELAGVMAHEIGHVVARHSSERLSALMAATMAGSLIVGAQDDRVDQMLTDLAVQLVTTGGFLAYSRANENEADRIGAEMMYQAGYDPQGMVSFFRKLHGKTGEVTRFEVFISTHPDPEDRKGRVKEFIETLPPKADLIWDSKEFQKVHARVAAIEYPEEKGAPD